MLLQQTKNNTLTMLAILYSLCFCCRAISQPAIPTDAFADISKHWLDQNPGVKNQYFQESDIQGIADNIVLYQRRNGGWPENKHMLRKLTHEEKKRVLQNKHKLDSSLDNRNTYPQIRYLMHAYQHTQHTGYLQAALQGFRYLFTHQYHNGGWAHSPPASKGYRQHITIADDVMTGVLSLLRDAANGLPPFNALPSEYTKQSRAAWKKGEQLLLDLQVRIDNQPTIWAGQYDKSTLAPVKARSYELPGLVSLESVSVVNYLMAEPKPSKPMKIAIVAAVRWLEKHKIEGLALEKVAAKPVRFKYHSATYDWVAKKQAGAAPLWARFYDLNTQNPFMARRDGTKVYKLSEVGRERRTGYTWYGTWPKTLLETTYPTWRSQHLKKPGTAGK